MQNWKKTISVATLCVTMLGPLPVSAMEQPLPLLPPAGEEATSAPQELKIVGDLVWIDLEGGFYSVEGYRLIGDIEVFKELLGQRVQVVGTPFEGFSIQMVKAINVVEIAPSDQQVVQTITGLLTWMDVEGGFYSVDGYRLIGDEAAIEPYLDQEVIVTGAFSDEPSIFMTKALNMDTIGPLVTVGKPQPPRGEQSEPRGKMVGATRKQPVTVIVDGEEVEFDCKLLVNDKTLMIPLRSIVEAAGGAIEWSKKEKTATVTMSDRMAYFVANEDEAEMNQHNVRYLMRNMIAMERAPKNIAGKLYISADALSSVLGMLEVGADGDVLNLITAPGILEPVDPVQEPIKHEIVSGTIKELKPNGRSRILLQGDAMSNGEAFLIWLSIDDNTKVLSASGDDALVADLAIGQEIRVELAGPVLESYPAQGAAATITIVK